MFVSIHVRVYALGIYALEFQNLKKIIITVVVVVIVVVAADDYYPFIS